MKVLQKALQKNSSIVKVLQNMKVLQKVLQNFQVLPKVLPNFLSIVKSIATNFKYCKKYCKIWKYCKVQKHYKKYCKTLRSGKKFSCGILYWILIGNNYFYIIHLSLIYRHFFVINSLWWIKLFPYVICWIQKLCLWYNFFDEYNYIKLKYYLKMFIDQYIEMRRTKNIFQVCFES